MNRGGEEGFWVFGIGGLSGIWDFFEGLGGFGFNWVRGGEGKREGEVFPLLFGRVKAISPGSDETQAQFLCNCQWSRTLSLGWHWTGGPGVESRFTHVLGVVRV